MKNLRTLYVREDGFVVRPASSLDSYGRMATLLYDGNSEVFEAWFDKDRDRGIDVLTYLVSQPTSFFSFTHLAVIEEKSSGHIIGLANVIDAVTRLDFDYSFMQNADHRAGQVIGSYIGGWYDMIKSHSQSTLMMPSFHIDKDYAHSRAGGQTLMSAILRWLNLEQYTKVITECSEQDTQYRNVCVQQKFRRLSRETRQYAAWVDPAVVSIFVHYSIHSKAGT